MKILVLGAGNVGCTIVFSLIRHPKNPQLYLYDRDVEKCKIQVDELNTGQNVCRVEVYNYEKIDIVINCIGNSSLLDKKTDRNNEKKLLLDSIDSILSLLVDFSGIFINVSNPCDVVTNLFAQKLKIAKTKIFGTGTALECARAKKNGIKSDFDIIGMHGEQNIFIGKELAKQQIKIKNEVWKIIEKKGYTNFGIANVVYQCVDTILTDKTTLMTLCAFHCENGLFYSEKCVLSSNGIEKVLETKLTYQQKQKLNKILNVLRHQIT